MATGQADFKVTYSLMGLAQAEALHKAFDGALEEVEAMMGQTYPNYIGGAPYPQDAVITSRSPIDTTRVLGHFASATKDDTQAAVAAAKAAYPAWRDRPWQERVALMRRAAEGISARKYFLAAVMSLEVGKSRMEAMGDAEEAADLIRYYAQQMEDAEGFVRPMGRLSPNEDVVSVLRPFGVWAVVAPFNFPLALSAGMSAGALVAGNTVVYKPSGDAPWTGLLLYEIYQEAGLPAGVFNFVNGEGAIIGEELVANPDVDGFVFTGSNAIGMATYHKFSSVYPKPCITEMGGKNPAILTAKADVEKAAEGVMRAAFGLGGQKCSACSRVYVNRSLEKPFLDLLVAKTKAIVLGDPSQRDVFLGPLVNDKAYQSYQQYIETIRRDGGTILIGGQVLTEPPFDQGYFVAPTVVTGLPHDHPFFYEELFVPILLVAPVDSLEEAVALANRADYGLTAGIYSTDTDEVNWFFDHIESGVCYANRRSGATTGAWPGVQPFCGWKGSGSTGKGGCGPYYVQQFLREQSRTVMTD